MRRSKQAKSDPRHPVRYHVLAKPMKVSECLREHFKLPPARLDELLILGAVYHEGRRVTEDLSLPKGARLTVHLRPRRYPVEEVSWRETLIHEAESFVVVDKPAGIPIHATVDNRLDNVLHQLRLLTGHHLLVTQRLDLPVGGLMILGKTPEFQRDFNKWLEERKVRKRYRALTETPPPPGRQIHFMEPDGKDPLRLSREPRPGWLTCELTVHAAKPVFLPEGGAFDVEVELHTGRMHQIRAQLAALGCPVIGDRLYGSPSRYVAAGKRRGIALFSWQIAWGALSFRANPPWAT